MTFQTRASWQIKEEAVVQELLKLINISPAECALLAELRLLSVHASPAMTEDFYARLLAHPETREYLENHAMDSLHMNIAQWFQELFSGNYDAEYTQKRLTIGKVHVRIGLPVRYPIAMLDVVIRHGEEIARKSKEPEQAVAAFRKIIALDLAVFNQAYEDNQLSHLAELVGGERLARLLLAGKG